MATGKSLVTCITGPETISNDWLSSYPKPQQRHPSANISLAQLSLDDRALWFWILRDSEEAKTTMFLVNASPYIEANYQTL